MAANIAAAQNQPSQQPQPAADQPPGPLERFFLRIYDAVKKIFVKISEFFSKLFQKNQRGQTPPPVTRVDGQQVAPNPAPPNQPGADLAAVNPATVNQAAVNPADLNQAIPEEPPAVRELLRDLHRWKRPSTVLNQFENAVPAAEKEAILERLGRGLPLGHQDQVLNQVWRDQDGVNGRYKDLGRDFIRRNPRLLIREIEALYPGIQPAN